MKEPEILHSWKGIDLVLTGSGEHWLLSVDNLTHSELVDEALAELARLSASRWVSVEERLPETSGPKEFLVVKEGERGQVGYYRYSTTATWSQAHGKFLGDPYGTITHWQPLPDPPSLEPPASSPDALESREPR